MFKLAKRINWPFVNAIGICILIWAAVIWRVAGAFGA